MKTLIENSLSSTVNCQYNQVSLISGSRWALPCCDVREDRICSLQQAKPRLGKQGDHQHNCNIPKRQIYSPRRWKMTPCPPVTCPALSAPHTKLWRKRHKGEIKKLHDHRLIYTLEPKILCLDYGTNASLYLQLYPQSEGVRWFRGQWGDNGGYNDLEGQELNGK